MKGKTEMMVKAAPAGLILALACTGCAHMAPHGETRKPVIVFESCQKPAYPRADIREEHQGTVTLAFLVNAEGTATEAKVLRSTGYPSLDMAAQAGLMTCKFKPALVDGQAVAQWANVQYVWKLD
jgi:protein TonB